MTFSETVVAFWILSVALGCIMLPPVTWLAVKLAYYFIDREDRRRKERGA